MRSELHDAVVLELESLLKHAGFHIKHEERHMFSTLENNNNSRPDITINNPALLNYGSEMQPATQVIIDVSFTCVLDGVTDGKIKSASTRAKAMKIGTKATTRFNDKFRHYKNLIQQLPAQLNPGKIWIVPFVFQTTGFLHGDSLDLLKRMVDAAEDGLKIPGINLITYFKRRLSCCLARNLARGINQRSHSVMGHCSFTRDRTFDARHIMEVQADE